MSKFVVCIETFLKSRKEGCLVKHWEVSPQEGEKKHMRSRYVRNKNKQHAGGHIGINCTV